MKNQDKYKSGRYGFVTLTQIVDRFMIHSFNNGQRYYKNMLRIGADAWKQLYWKTMRETRTKRVKVDRGTMTVKIPSDCVKLVGVSLLDRCDQLYPLSYDPFRIVSKETELPGGHGCGCTKCNCHSEACGIFNGIMYVEEDVEMNGVMYKKVIRSKVTPSGILVEEISEPFVSKNADGEDVVTLKTHSRQVATLSVKPCGCVEPTVENLQKCYDFCGCPTECCDRPELNSTELLAGPHARGYYKVDDEYPDTIYLYDGSAQYAYITYVTNGEECDNEIIIPEYCQEAMMALLYLGSIRFRSNVSGAEKREAKMNAEMEAQELYEFLNPLVEHEFLQLQHQFYKW